MKSKHKASIVASRKRLDINTHKKHIINVIGLTSLIMLAALGYVALTPRLVDEAAAVEYCKGPNGYVECDTTSQINTYARLAPVVSIGMQGDVVMDVTPKSTGVLIEEPVSVTVSTNSAEGYSLYMRTLNDTNALTSTNPDDPSLISAVVGEVTSTGMKEQGNVWGYSLNPEGSTAEIIYKAVPVSQAAPVRVTDSVVAGGTDNLELTFGMHVDTSLPSGAYSNAVLVSAVANPATISSLSELTFMQDMTGDICENTAYDINGATDPTSADPLSPVTKQLIDTRDGKKYWVAKLKDGNCWMTQDLALDLEQGKTLYPSNTNIAEPWTPQVSTQHDDSKGLEENYGSFNPGKYVFNYAKSAGRCINAATDFFSLTDERCGSYVTNVDGWDDDFTANNTNTIDLENKTYDAHYLIGNYYAPKIVTADYHGVSAEYDICPKNWQMPKSNSNDRYTGYETADYFRLFNAYDDTGWTEHSFDGIMHNYRFNNASYYGVPFYFAQSGFIHVSGSFQHIGYSYKWESNYATKNAPLAMGVGYGDNNIMPFITNQTQFRNVRCLAKQF